MATYRVNGCLNLQFNYSAEANKTDLHIVSQTPPLRVVRAFEVADGAALAHLHNVSGGVLGGDHLEVAVTVDPQARAQVTTPGATRIYRHRPGGPVALQTNRFTVEAGGLLEYLPDPLIPFAQARYRQVTQIDLADGAGLFWWEVVAPGREAREELFAYDRLELAVDLKARQRPIALERLKIEPRRQPPASIARFGPYRYGATFYICRVGLPEKTWLELEAALRELAQTFTSPEALWAVNALVSDGLVVRALSCTGQEVSARLLEFWRLAKEKLYGEAIIPPRKLY